MKLYRRSFEKKQTGYAGALSSVKASRTGTDGVVTGSSFSAPTALFNSASASFVSGDVGRKIRIEGTPGHRYDWVFIIDAVLSGSQVRLRFNHNLTGHPGSYAVFMEDGTSISWTILPSATFTADYAGQFAAAYDSGSFITIQGTGDHNEGTWEISHLVDNQNVILTRNWYWTIIDCNPFTTYAVNDPFGFTTATALNWFMHDRQPTCQPDLYQMMTQHLIDAGWLVVQQMGPYFNGSSWAADLVLWSAGEDNTNMLGGATKNIYLRQTQTLYSRAGLGIYNNNYIDQAIFNSWDPTKTSGLSRPGYMSGGMRPASWTKNAHIDSTDFGSPGIINTWDNTNTDWSLRGHNSYPAEQVRGQYVMLADRDEICCVVQLDASINVLNQWVWSFVKPLTTNPNIANVITAINSGDTAIDVGTVDMSVCTPPYQVGDQLTIVGYKADASTPEWVETVTITGFDNTITSHRKVNVTAVSGNYAQGTAGSALIAKAQVGEDPFPIGYFANASGIGNTNCRSHNTAKAAASGRDYDFNSFGFDCSTYEPFGIAELDPNRRTARYGLTGLIFRNNNYGEFRGRFRYVWKGSYRCGLYSKLLDRSGNVYVCVTPVSSQNPVFLGPIPKAQAGVL